MNLIGKEGFFRIDKGETWKEYDGKKCVVIKYDDESHTGVFVEFEDGQRLLIQTEEFEVILN